MKVLLAHCYYASGAPSGENRVVEAERRLLEAHGDQVFEFFRHNEELNANGVLGKLTAGLSAVWNPSAAGAIRRAATRLLPDVVHVHNTFPLLSPSIFRGVGRRAARVLTLHNYRIFCAAAAPMRDGKVCTLCLDGRSAAPAVRHACYRQSRVATLPVAASIALHRRLGTWANHVDAFIALSEFQRELMVRSGLPRERVHVKHNFVPGAPRPGEWSRRRGVVFAGRLSAEKGVATLLQAWRLWGREAPELRIVGDGALRGDLESAAEGLNVRFLGELPPEATSQEIAQAHLLVLPSQSFETFGLVVAEAFSVGTPVAVSAIGALPSIVREGDNGVLFPPGDPASLLAAVRQAWQDEPLLKRLGAGGRRSFEALYTEEANYAALMRIYERAIEASRRAA
jgi:glycosyltransferase involved in cell wall biosynthesis